MTIINRETDYAIRIIRALSDGKEKSVSLICEAQEFTKPFAYKIIKKLEKSGIVKISRGKQGGVSLSKELTILSLYELMDALGNSIYVNECFEPGCSCTFSQKNGTCGVHINLFNLQKSIDKELKNCFLSQLI